MVAPITRAAIFLVVCIRQDPDADALLRSFCADFSGLIRAVEFRDIEGMRMTKHTVGEARCSVL